MDWASLSPTHYGTPLIGQTLDLFQIIPNSFGRGGGGAGEAALGVWTQGLTFASQVLCLLSHAPVPY
jgi:hypothetical protein